MLLANGERVRVFVAGPYDRDWTARYVKSAKIGIRLLDAGFAPYVAEVSRMRLATHLRPDDVWTLLNLQWLRQSHALLQLPGGKPGPDFAERREAARLGLPVFYSPDPLIAHFSEELEGVL